MSASTTNLSGRDMDCARVARDEIVEGYLVGRLTEEDREAFEEHFFKCAHCFDDLRSLQAVQGELRQGGVEIQARQRPRWFPRIPAAGLAAGAVLTVLVLWMRPAPPSGPSEAKLPPVPQAPLPDRANPEPTPRAVASGRSPVIARQVIEAYYAAHKARDFNALQAIFPTATDIDRRRIEALREAYEPCDYNVQGMEIDAISNTRAYVRVHLTETCRPVLGSKVVHMAGAKTFELGKTADGRWIVITGPQESPDSPTISAR